MKNFRLVSIWVMVLGFVTAWAGAQVDTGSILGTVKDPTGGVVPGATVTLTHKQTNIVTRLTTDARGYYEAVGLSIGTYTLTVTLQGFRTATRENVGLRIQDRLRIDFTLELGSAENVVVTSEAPLLQTQEGSLGQVIESKQIEALPVARSFLPLAALTPGVWLVGGSTNGNAGEEGTLITNGMKAFVDRIHAAGLRAQLWWSPLSAKPGSRTEREHPDWLLRNADGSARKVSWWDTFYLCPAVEGVREDARAFVRKALGDWGFDGLKIDGQHLNGSPPCFNAAHGHASPEESPEGVPGFFRAIWEEAQATRSGAVVEICPCGTAYSFFTLPYLNMTVASDPESTWQVRLKGKTLKALHGSSIAYFGDHVEMERKGDDFASTLGVGGVVGSNFAWPGAPGKKDPKVLLTPEREKTWAFWVKLYQEKRLSEGEYLGELYDIGFDRPETHAIRKGDTLFYAFFADRFDGRVELRGLGPRRYRLRDYESGRDLGTVEGPRAPLEVAFKKHLLLEALPE